MPRTRIARPKSDSQVQRLLMSREGIFPRYTQGEFERVIGKYFRLQEFVEIRGSERTLSLVERKNG